MPRTKTTEQEQPDPNIEREQQAKAAHEALKKAKTADQVRSVWKEHYLKIGHRILGRLLVGATVEDALRGRRQKESD